MTSDLFRRQLDWLGEHCDVVSLRYFGFSLVPISLLFSRWLRRPLPFQEAVDPGRRPLSAWLLRTLFGIEKRLPMPLGVSLLLKAVRKQDAPARRQIKPAHGLTAVVQGHGNEGLHFEPRR